MIEDVLALFLRREHLVFLEDAASREPASRPSAEAAGLEAKLLDLGFAAQADLGQALRRLPVDALDATKRWIVATLEKELGSHRPHVPLFRHFPQNVPGDTFGLFVRRVVAWIAQEPGQPCLFCGQTKTVSALSPCGHLVCSACWDGSNYSACPICHFQVDRGHPFFEAAPERPALAAGSARARLTLLHLGHDLAATARAAFERWVGRRAPLPPRDREDLQVLLAAYGDRALGWLPATIPVKETQALVLGTLLRTSADPSAMLEAVRPRLRTATDVLRVLAVYSGHSGELIAEPTSTPAPTHPLLRQLARAQRIVRDGALSARPADVKAQRRTRLPRALRRGVLAILEALPQHLLLEDMQRHAPLWKWAGERLHPFEWHARFPRAAVAFACIRETRIDGVGALASALRAAASSEPTLAVEDGVLRFRGWGRDVEEGFRSGELEQVIKRLGERPGELLRRADHALRAIHRQAPGLSDRWFQALEAACPRGSTPVLLTLQAHLAARSAPLPRRVFFPRGQVANLFQRQDDRPVLSAVAVERCGRIVEGELLRRAVARRPFARAILDERLADLLIPFNERTTSKALVAVPRGSTLPVPNGGRFRLFAHWMDKADFAVDLDLSVAFYNAEWRHVGQCDFTNLTFEGGAAIHSGDLRSGPPPDGASEFVDLDVEKLAAHGVRHAVMVIFSYTGISFDTLPEAFAGFLPLHGAAGPIFDARAVEQRFDLSGAARAAVPMIVDVETGRLLWTDVKLPVDGQVHSVGTSRGGLAHLGLDLTAYFGAKARPTMWQLACLHAAARAGETWVARADDQAWVYRRHEDESLLAFYHRLVRHGEPDDIHPHMTAGDAAILFAGLKDNVELPPDSLAYALRWTTQSATEVRRLAAPDLVADLAPLPV
jgi:hypothetical protein